MDMKRTTSAITALLVALLLVGWGNMRGVCYARLRPLDDEERIRAAVSHLLKNIRPGGRVFAMQGDRAIEVSSPVSDSVYLGIDDFLARNPGCCSVMPVMGELGHAPGGCARLFGNFSGYVRIEYLDPGNPDVTQRNAKRTSHLAVTNCGEVWDGI